MSKNHKWIVIIFSLFINVVKSTIVCQNMDDGEPKNIANVADTLVMRLHDYNAFRPYCFGSLRVYVTLYGAYSLNLETGVSTSSSQYRSSPYEGYVVSFLLLPIPKDVDRFGVVHQYGEVMFAPGVNVTIVGGSFIITDYRITINLNGVIFNQILMSFIGVVPYLIPLGHGLWYPIITNSPSPLIRPKFTDCCITESIMINSNMDEGGLDTVMIIREPSYSRSILRQRFWSYKGKEDYWFISFGGWVVIIDYEGVECAVTGATSGYNRTYVRNNFNGSIITTSCESIVIDFGVVEKLVVKPPNFMMSDGLTLGLNSDNFTSHNYIVGYEGSQIDIKFDNNRMWLGKDYVLIELSLRWEEPGELLVRRFQFKFNLVTSLGSIYMTDGRSLFMSVSIPKIFGRYMEKSDTFQFRVKTLSLKGDLIDSNLKISSGLEFNNYISREEFINLDVQESESGSTREHLADSVIIIALLLSVYIHF